MKIVTNDSNEQVLLKSKKKNSMIVQWTYVLICSVFCLSLMYGTYFFLFVKSKNQISDLFIP